MCPKCRTPAQPATAPQICTKCSLTFVLRYGALMDEAVTPVLEEGGKEFKSKAAGLMMAEQSMVTVDSIGSGTLDPIVGRFTVDTKSVGFDHLYSVAMWRALNVAQLVTFFLVSGPMGLISLFVTGLMLSKGEPGAVICTLPLVLMSAYHAYSVFRVRTTRLRVVGFKDRTLDISVGGRLGKQREFIDAFFRRAGLAPVEIQ
jgi:hypothetical protein